MKKIKDFADEINKCSKCGLCQSVCPVFKETGNDCAVSKGKFIMLDGVLKGDLELNQNINKYLDLCLKCGKCKDFCPSSIDVCEIFAAAKCEYFNKTTKNKFISFLQSKFVFSNFVNVAKALSNPFRRKSLKGKAKLLYFKGCVNNVWPAVENAVKKVLENLDVELIEQDFDCCGMPFLSSGNGKRFEQAKAKNLKIIRETDFDYILTDCASCESTLKTYTDAKFINITEFISKQNKRFIFDTPVKVTFHKPCHMGNADFVKQLFEKCENLEYIEMEGYDDCCGLAGEFVLHNPKISAAIAKRKAEHIRQTQADYVLTACPACVMGLIEGLALTHGKNIKVMNIIEFLAKAKTMG